MSASESKTLNPTEMGQKLVEHSKSTEFTATHGLVVDLFPFLFEASARMSARAIHRYLQEEQKVKLSQVTISRALGDPKKSWVSYFSKVEAEAITIAKWTKARSFDFLFKSKAEFEKTFSFEEEGIIGSKLARGIVTVLRPDRAAAIQVLREKWFGIGQGIRLKAKPYLEEHLMSLRDKF